MPSFAGSVPEPSDDAQLAASTMGAGGIQVSPLAMAMIAAQVDSGGWHAPSLVTTAGDPPAASAASASGGAVLSDQVVGALRSLMRASVRSGAAHGANLDGPAVYGQTGQAAFGQAGRGVQASWFVGYRGDVAFAVLELGKSRHGTAVSLAARFLNRLPASLLGS
jgi:cell division protein FtsI/penicillin-binding protein 2